MVLSIENDNISAEMQFAYSTAPASWAVKVYSRKALCFRSKNEKEKEPRWIIGLTHDRERIRPLNKGVIYCLLSLCSLYLKYFLLK